MAGNRIYNLTGIGVPTYPATAAQWANSRVDIPGWQVVDNPQPGDIYSSGHHMGFVVERHDSFNIPNRGLTGISASPGNGVRENPYGIVAPNGTKFTYRRYIGGN